MLNASWVGRRPYPRQIGRLYGAWWPAAPLGVWPIGLAAAGCGEPRLLPQQFVAPEGIAAPDAFGVGRVLHDWEYAPAFAVLDASWVGQGVYAAPVGVLNGAWSRPSVALHVALTGWDASAFGQPLLPVLAPAGFDGAAVGLAHVRNAAAQIRPAGLSAGGVGRALVWNWRQYARVRGIGALWFGRPLVQGGVKYVLPKGWDASHVPWPVVVNTRADQFARPRSIEPPAVPEPAVSPQMLWPVGIHGTQVGYALVQFPPQPLGWLSSALGYPVVRDKTSRAAPEGIDSLALGFPRVRDRAQKIAHRASPVTAVFGDTSIRLLNHFIRPQGVDALQAGIWSVVYSTRRMVLAKGADGLEVGLHAVANKTPALWPQGLDALQMGLPDAGGYYRTIYPAGIVPAYPQVASPSLWQTPGLSPVGIEPQEVPGPTVWPKVREVLAQGAHHDLFGGAQVGFAWRQVRAEGSEASQWGGDLRVEHALRSVNALGDDALQAGQPWVSHGLRAVQPEGIEYPYMHLHKVGTRRWIGAVGFEATRWLKRITPEARLLEQRGKRSDQHGLARIENASRSVFVAGITTYPEPVMHWGVARVWNMRQFIVQVEDAQSGLTPPPWPRWTLVENRNKLLGALGFDAGRYGRAVLSHAARAVAPAGVAAPAMVQWPKPGLVSHAVRALPLAGIEPVPISRWTVVHNKAEPVLPVGFAAQQVGAHAVVNLRRFYRMVGFESPQFGQAMVAFAVRELTFEGRYAIAPLPMALPQVKLFTRYVQPLGMDGMRPYESTKMGLALLETRFNRITPRWTQQHDHFGSETRVRNKTPEFPMRGWDSNQWDWGDALVRHQWRSLAPDGTDMALFGRARIADRTQTVWVEGNQCMVVSDKVRVRRVGLDPVATQYIDLRKWIDTDRDGIADTEDDEGYGIPDDSGRFFGEQVPRPDLLKGYVWPDSHGKFGDMLEMGRHKVTANTIRVEPGYHDFHFGQAAVSLKVRRLDLNKKGIGPLVEDGEDPKKMGSWGLPRLSPHTIYAVLEASAQAKRNHGMKDKPLYPVNEGIEMGRPRVSGFQQELKPHGIPESWGGWPEWGVGRARLENLVQVIEADGVNACRFGWASIPGARTIVVAEEEKDVIFQEALGRPTLHLPRQLTSAHVPGWRSDAWGKHGVEHRHRTLGPKGWDSAAVPKSIYGAPIRMPQQLYVGEPIVNPIEGFDASGSGSPWISHWVRGLTVDGWDSFACEYDVEHFAKRMRVRRTQMGPEISRIGAQGIAPDGTASLPDVGLHRHVIRPDAIWQENWRQGAQTVSHG
ncbi:hypothetical protein EII18_08375 [Comamonadaceae bacterium OH3737_COT-264]|nr:hypothetical protein EII18_08375 [Comamonadaceae bacterium OH3737_COT-264]